MLQPLLSFKNSDKQGAWAAQLVERLTLGFSSGCDLRVVRLIEPRVWLHTQHKICLRVSLYLSLPPASTCTLLLSLK